MVDPKPKRVSSLDAERFNRKIEAELAKNGNDYADAYLRVTGMAPPTPTEAKRYRELRIGDRASLDECLKAGYDNPGAQKARIQARLVEIALHSPSESAAVAATNMLANMEGWNAPKQVKGQHLHVGMNMAELLKEIARRNREPGEPERIIEIEDGTAH